MSQILAMKGLKTAAEDLKEGLLRLAMRFRFEGLTSQNRLTDDAFSYRNGSYERVPLERGESKWKK